MSDRIVAQSQAAITQGSKSFAAAARLFDRQTREDAVMLYAWCRHCDDVIDGQTLGHGQKATFRAGQRARLDDLRKKTAGVLSGARLADPEFEAIRRVVHKHQIPVRHLEELLDGFAMDVDERRYATLNDTLEYCYGVAGVVGVMMSMIMGARDSAVLDRAADLGLAFQLTNIARDVIEDARVGRVYVPDEILARHGIGVVDADDLSQRPALHAAAVDLLDVAERYYDSSKAGIAVLPLRSAWAIAAARRVYRDIGAKLRKRGPAAWEKRVSTGKLRKMYLLALSLADVVVYRVISPEQSRQGLWQRPS
ncbi:MAG: phytoene/squalene synthase family protein [Aestuariivirga sp.]